MKRIVTPLHLALMAGALSAFTPCVGQPGTLDTKFATAGVWTDPAKTNYTNMGAQPDGKLIVLSGRRIGRFHTNGTPDTSFGINGWAGVGNEPYEMVVQHDGKIVYVNQDNVYRLNADGTTDTSFGDGGTVVVEVFGFSITLLQMAVDNNNRVVVAGRAQAGTPGNANGVLNALVFARLNTNGTFDTTLGNTGIRVQLNTDNAWHNPVGCGIDQQGNIVIGIARGGNFDNDDFITRYTERGALDTQLAGGTGMVLLNRDLDKIAVAATGRVAYTTLPKYVAGVPQPPTIGYIDATLTNRPLGTMSVDRISAIEYQDDGKLVVAGSNDFGGGINGLYVRRYTADGIVDQTFAPTDGTVHTDLQYDIRANDILFRNRRLYIAARLIHFESPQANIYDHYGLLLGYDGSEAHLRCPSPLPQYGADPGQCYATVNNLNATFNVNTLYANMKHTVVYNGVTQQGEGSVSGRQFGPGITTVTYTYTDVTTQSCTFNIEVADKEAPTITCPPAITTTVNFGQCYATISLRDLGVAKVSSGCGTVTITRPTLPPNNQFPIGETILTWTATDGAGNTSTCTQTITVIDNQAPVMIVLPRIVATNPGQCYATLTPTNLGTPLVIDNCGKYKITAPTLPTGNIFTKGTTELLWSVTDASGNTRTATQYVIVVDNEAPTIAKLGATPSVLTPPNNSLVDVTISYATADNCGVAREAISRITSNEPLDRNDYQIIDSRHIRLRAERNPRGNGRTYTITVSCTDASGNTTQRTIAIPVGTDTKPGTNARTIADTPGIENADESSSDVFTVNAYPNPTTSTFVIDIADLENSPATLTVINATGQTVETIGTVANTVHIGEAWKAGVYMVEVVKGLKRKVVKVVKN